MYDSSEAAIEANEVISTASAARELRRHHCRILAVDDAKRMIQVTNDCDAPEWIACTTAAVLLWLGY